MPSSHKSNVKLLPPEDHADLVGLGLYTIPEASRVTGVSQGRVRRWVKGYHFRSGEDARSSEPIWALQIPPLDGSISLGFLDLMEVRFIDAFREAGVGWKTIRFAAHKAKELLHSEHPFSSKVFKTDGRTIFAQIVQPSGRNRLLDLAKSQYAFNQVISPSLYKGIEFSTSNQAIRWWPMGLRRKVVLDPARSFGQPIVSDEGVPTGVLATAHKVAESVEIVAHHYEVSPRSVRDAIEFERKLAT